MPFTRFHFLAPLSVVVLFLVGANATQAQTAIPYEEFVGPFASWRQVQCSGGDDTAMLQNELNTLGKPGNSPVLYLKPSTCRITSTLTLQGREKVTFLGADPATTRIVWAGAAGGTMFHINGVGHSRFGRITWDHNGIPGDAIDSIPDGSAGNFFPTDNRHEDEVITGMVVGADGDMNVGARLGIGGGTGDGETTWMREKFNNAQAAMLLGNPNVLDHWIWDSLFQNNRYGITDFVDSAASAGTGAGGWGVNRSVFLGNSSDMGIGNSSFTSARWNYARGWTYRHIDGGPIASAINPMTVQGETMIDTGAVGGTPVHMANPGPLALIDSTLSSPNQVESYPTGADILSIGNKFSSRTPYTLGGDMRLHQVDDQVGTPVTDPGPPTLPSTPQNMNRPVFEPASKDSAGVQAAINQAAASAPRAVVHLPYGNYTFTSTVTIPANATLQLVGDGYGATVIGGAANPLISVAGPSQPVLRDFSLGGSGQTSGQQGIVINTANQPNGLVHLEDVTASQVKVGLLVDGTNQTLVDSLDSQVNSTSSADYRATNGATLRIFNGASCCSTGSIYDVQSGSTIVAQNMYFENGSPAQLVAPNGKGTVVADVGKVTGQTGTAANVSTFNGTSVLQNLQTMDEASVIGGNNTFLYGNTSSPAPTDAHGTFLNWGARYNHANGGTNQVAETSAGVSNASGYLRQHEAPLRAAVPTPLTSRPSGVTDVRTYRIGGENMGTFFTVTGTPAPASAATATPIPTATTPAPPSAPVTGTPMPTTPSTASGSTTFGGTTAFVTGVTSHVSLRNDFTGQVGASITVGSTPLTITDLGRYLETGNSGTHTLGLYKASDGSLVASATLNLATAKPDSTGFAYAPLASSVTLPAGGVYYLVSSETSGGDTWEGWPIFPTVAHTTAATMSGAVWQNGSRLATAGAGPGPDQVYVPVSFKYQAPV